MALLLAVSPAAGATREVQAGDSATYAYTQALVNHLPNGTAYTQSYVSEFEVLVVSVNDTVRPGVIGYIVSFTEAMNRTTSQAGGVNFTDFFDPYDNETYLGAIGFYPFIHTDLQPGSRNGLPVTVAITQGPNGTVTETNTVDVTVTRAGGFLTVNYTARAGTALQPSSTLLEYNATNGVLNYGTTRVLLAGIERDFTFSLESYTTAEPPGVPLLAYAIGGSFVLLAAVFVIDRLRGLRRRRVKRFGR